MTDNIMFVNMSLARSKCLFEVWLFNESVIDDKIAMTAIRCRLFRKNAPIFLRRAKLHNITTSNQ